MKTKYLFGMLLSGAMLAACTADDFDTAQVKQQALPSAPVFTVHFDDGTDGVQNRASYTVGAANVQFDGSDLLSLFNGMDMTGSGTLSTTPTLNGWDNAVYYGKVDGDEFTYATQSMVRPGLAVMVYPADTQFKNNSTGEQGSSAPKLFIEQDQTYENSTTKVPYMSEILNLAINPSWDGSQGQAGYGQTNYDILLRKVGTNLDLALDINDVIDHEAIGVPKVDIKKIELVSDVDVFTTAVPVMIKGLDASDGNGTPTAPAAYDASKGQHLTWYAASELDLSTSSITQVSRLSTTDIREGKDGKLHAEFVMLPFGEDVDDTYWGTTKMKAVIYTQYGTIEIKAADENWYGKDTDATAKYKTIADGLKGIYKAFWQGAPTNSKNFYHSDATRRENVGATAQRELKFSMNDLKLDGMHFDNETDLRNALKVYNTLHAGATDQVKVYMDDTYGVFEMSKATADAIIAEYSKTNPVVCYPCNNANGGHHASWAGYAVRLVNNDAVQEVPQLKLGKLASDSYNNDQAVELQLAGNWKMTGVANNKYTTFAGISQITVLKDANLDLVKNKITGEDAPTSTPDLTTMVVNNGGNVTVNDLVYMELEMENHGTITIGEAGDLRAYGKTITNHALSGNYSGNGGKVSGLDNATYTKNEDGTYTTTGAGLIVNKHFLQKADNTDGAVENYGIIINATADAQTRLAKNADDNVYLGTDKFVGVLTTGITNLKRVGTVVLFDKNSKSLNISIQNTEKGFIKQTVNEKNPTKDDFSIVANYIIVGEDCETLTYAYDDEKKAELNVPSSVKYFELLPKAGATTKTVTVEGQFSWFDNGARDARIKGLIVPKGCQLYIPETSKIRMVDANTNDTNYESCIYVKGLITYSGTGSFDFDKRASFEGYFGGASGDQADNVANW